MNYDLTIKEERKRFVKRANMLLAKQRRNVKLIDESNRTPDQNSYMHVLCRILALDTGVSEDYAKQVYFKDQANHDIFYSASKDKITGKMETFIRSSRDMSIPDMSKAISRFLVWAAEQGFNLPQASLNDDGTLIFASDKDKEAFHKAQIATSNLDDRDII